MIGLNLLQPRGVTTPKNKDAFHHKETRKLIWNHFDIGLWAWWLVVHHYVKNIDGIIIPVLCLSLIVDLWVVKKWYVVCCPLAMAVSWVWSLHRISPPLFKSHIILLMAINSIIIIFSAVVQVVFFVSGGRFLSLHSCHMVRFEENQDCQPLVCCQMEQVLWVQTSRFPWHSYNHWQVRPLEIGRTFKPQKDYPTTVSQANNHPF